MRKLSEIILSAVVMTILTACLSASAQDTQQPKFLIINTLKEADATPLWARLEVRASWTEKGQKRYETRAYYSNIIEVSNAESSNRHIKGNLIQYFNQGIVEQLKARGIEINYYESDVAVYPRNASYNSRQEAEQEVNGRMDVDRSNERAIYTFVWKYNATNVSEDITQPKRIYSVKPAPASEATKVAPDIAGREAKAQAARDAEKEAEAAQQQKMIWGYATLNVSVRKTGREFSRTYVSEIAPVSRADYNAYYNTDERFIKPRIWEYFAATVVAAAKERGEEIQEPYDSSISYKFSLATTGSEREENYYQFQPKSVLEEPRQSAIDYEKQSSRPVFFFRWDPSGKNAAQDLQREKARGTSTTLPN